MHHWTAFYYSFNIIKDFKITNLRFNIEGYHIDAAIDNDWVLHCYTQDEVFKKHHTAIELYNFDEPDWDVRVIYQEQLNTSTNTVVDIDALIQEIKAWIKLMKD